jgi:hypothetical protein
MDRETIARAIRAAAQTIEDGSGGYYNGPGTPVYLAVLAVSNKFERDGRELGVPG